MSKVTILVGVACLVLGLVAGIFIGRSLAEREWSQPRVLERLSAADAQRSSGKDANPTPAAGSLVLRPAPLARSRMVMAEVTKTDPVVMKLGDVADGDEGNVLNLELMNNGKCTVSAFSGTAYGFDAYGKPSSMNKAGEHYVAFSESDVKDFAPGKTHSFSSVVHHVSNASLAVAQVDQVTCADGSKWARN
jgi:hypothetical protein